MLNKKGSLLIVLILLGLFIPFERILAKENTSAMSNTSVTIINDSDKEICREYWIGILILFLFLIVSVSIYSFYRKKAEYSYGVKHNPK